MKRLGEFAISLVLAGLILWALLRRFDLPQTVASVRQANLRLLILGAALMAASYLVRAARWRIWERSLSYWNSFRLILIGFMGNNILPARLGEILRAHCAAAKADDEERGRTAFLASIAAERVFDGLILSVFAGAAIAVTAVDRGLEAMLLIVALAFAGLTLGLILGIHKHDRLRLLISALNRKFPGRLTKLVQERGNQLLDGLVPLGTGRRMPLAVTVTALIWGLETAFCYCAGRAVWGGMSVGAALLFLVVVNFASLIPLTMGGIGTIEVAGPVFLISAGVAAPVALAMVLLQHAGQYLFTTMTGGIIYLTAGFHRIPLGRPKAGRLRPPQSQAPSGAIEETRSSLAELAASVRLRPTPRGEVRLSVVIPSYNEQARLPRTAIETIRWCGVRDLEFELLIMDDGSRDETLALARLLEQNDSRVRAFACPHMGKGAAVRMGMLNATGRFVLFMDADGATPLDEIPKLFAAIEAGHDVAIGSRSLRRGEAELKSPFHRRFLGRAFSLLANLLAVGGVADTQCGFKMFRREAVSPVFSRQKLAGFAFDVEILYIARQLSLSIAEVPVNWFAQPGSRVNLMGDSARMLCDISRIRWLHRHFEAPPLLADSPQPHESALGV